LLTTSLIPLSVLRPSVDAVRFTDRALAGSACAYSAGRSHKRHNQELLMALRGRGATPVRPGLTTKGVLMGEVPLATGELVTEAAITDLHGAYKELIKRENALRPKAKQLRGMTYRSFLTLFKFAQLLNLVELVREEPMQFPPPRGSLYSVRKPDGIKAVISTRRIFKISAIGAEDELSWTNLCKAWMESWPAPQKVEYAPPYAPPPKVERPPRVKPPVELKPFRWVSKPSTRQFGLLLAHLEGLQSLGIDKPGVGPEVDRLAMLIGDWLIEIKDSLEEAKAIEFTERVVQYEKWEGAITATFEGLMDRDLDRCVEALRELAG